MKPTIEHLTAQFTRLLGLSAHVSAPAAAPVAVAQPESGAGLKTALPTPAAAAPGVAAAATASAPATPVAAEPAPVQAVAHALKGYDFDATVPPAKVAEAAALLDAEGFGLDAISGVDWLPHAAMEVVYDYFHPTEPLRVVVRCRIPRTEPELPSIAHVFPGANWHEREAHDFFGLRFTGHPNLKPFLLPEDADFHPLRKDYQP